MSFFKPREKRTATSPAPGTPPAKKVQMAPSPLPPPLPTPLKSARSTKPTNFRPVRLNGTGWVKLDDHEAQLAAYLGFQNTSDLRAFAISWPSLVAEKSFAPAAKNMKKTSPFTLLHNSGLRSQIAGVTSSPELVWTWQSSDSMKHQTNQRKKIVAWSIWNMVLNVKQYKSLSVAENLARTQAEQAEFLNRHPSNKQGVSLSFPESMDHFPCPELGPLTEKGENELESYNRCWELLRYIASGFYKANWKNRFATTEAVQNGSTVNDSHSPTWMQKPKPKVLPDLSSVRQSFTSDQLPPIEVKVHWVHNAEVAEYDDTVLAIKKARRQNVNVPGSQFKFPWDPRLFATGAQFRDSLRRSLNCQALGLDFQSLFVIYHRKDANCDEQADGLLQDWTTLRGVFESSNNSNFILEVRMEPYDTEDVIYSLYEDDNDPIDPITYLAIQNSQSKEQQIHRQETSTGPEESSGITEKTPQQAAEKETAGAA